MNGKKLICIITLTITILVTSYCFFNSNFQQHHKRKSPFLLAQNLIENSYRVNFLNLDKEVDIGNLEVIGKIPKWLSGTLFRNGPAQFTNGKSWVTSWFDGLAMVHAFTFENGNVSYINKFLRTDDYYYVKNTGNMRYWGFAQDPCKWFFKSLTSMFIPKSLNMLAPNANVNFASFDGRLVALTETPLPIEFDKKNLETLGVLKYADNLPKVDIHDTAHPHYDFETQEHIAYFTSFGIKSKFNVYRIKKGNTKREIFFSIDVDKPSYMHSFFLTKNYAIFTFLPLVITNPFALLFKKYAFIHNFNWIPELGTKFVVIDRVNNKLKGIYKTGSFFAFHTVNAYEIDNKIVLDIVNYPDNSIIDRADFINLMAANPIKPKTENLSYLRRYVLDLKSGSFESSKLCDITLELPRINYKKHNGKFYKYVYCISSLNSIEYAPKMLIKLDVNNGKKNIWHQENCYVSEPIFVESPNAISEDDGIVLSVVLDADKAKSFLLILDAKNFKELARAFVPHSIPFGIHGIYRAN